MDLACFWMVDGESDDDCTPFCIITFTAIVLHNIKPSLSFHHFSVLSAELW